MYKFEGLQVWQEGIKLATICYGIANTLPDYERSGLSDQLRRAVSSILFNIAEGSGEENDKEFLRFLHISRKSLYETISILKFIEHIYKRVELKSVFQNCDTVGKLLNGLIRKLNNDKI